MICNLIIKFNLIANSLDPPAPETLMRALELLNYLGALDDEVIKAKKNIFNFMIKGRINKNRRFNGRISS